MPLHWTINSKAKLLTVVAEGVVSQADFESYLDLIDQAGLHAYRKLFDGIDADTSMGPEQILAIGVRMRTSHHTQSVGPLAVAVAEDKVPMVSRVLGMLAAANRPMRVFHESGPARLDPETAALQGYLGRVEVSGLSDGGVALPVTSPGPPRRG